MSEFGKYDEQILEQIGQKRFDHTMGVVEMAERLAAHYGADVEKAKLAALFHDCAKYPSHDKLIEEANRYHLEITEDMRLSPSLIHAPLGAIIAKEEFSIHDEEVLNAIAHHTTGKVGMGKLEQIVFVADFIEGGRIFEGVDYFREIAFQDLDLAMIKILDHTISYLMETGSYIGVETVKCRNYFLHKHRASHL